MDALSLAGKVAVVTGGTSGIGREICLRFARAGAQVVAAGRRNDAGKSVVAEIEASGGSARFVETDVTDPGQVARLIGSAEEDYGQVSVLVSAAGVMLIGSAPETSVDAWRTTIETDLSGPFYLAKYGIPALLRAGGGTMVVVASELGLVGAREAAAYCAAKGGLVNMVRALAVDHAPQGVRINCLCPGPIDTPLLQGWFAAGADPSDRERQQVAPVPLGRLGRVEEIAEAALFLASDASSYFAGSIVVADGGATAWYGL
ncbi:MAG: SDR family oxidoreductase [Chloroflexi bacterium]|nr:SDR family oxidoreductase [Chloroflexota bacterium]